MAQKPSSPALTLNLGSHSIVHFNERLLRVNDDVPDTLLKDSKIILQDVTTWKCPNIMTNSESSKHLSVSFTENPTQNVSHQHPITL